MNRRDQRRPTSRLTMTLALSALSSLVLLAGCATPAHLPAAEDSPSPAAEITPPAHGEVRFSALRRLNSAAESGVARFGPRGEGILFESIRDGFQCAQLFVMPSAADPARLASTGVGVVRGGAFLPGDDGRIVYASTHAARKTCPPPTAASTRVGEELDPALDLYVSGPPGAAPTPLAPHPGHDAEPAVSPDGTRVVFTSTRSGHPDLWSVGVDGGDLKQLSETASYEGGATFSPDGALLAYHARSEEAVDLWVMRADGGEPRQVVSNGAVNLSPSFHPDGEHLVFASNLDDPDGDAFHLYLVGLDGEGMERLTYASADHRSPSFSADGTRLLFTSTRGGATRGGGDLFVATWHGALPAGPEAALEAEAAIDPATWLARAATLADPTMRGRGLGTPQLEEAAAYLADEFAAMGLEPAGDVVDGEAGYLQRFSVPVSSRVERATLRVGQRRGRLDRELRPFPFSGNGVVEEAPVVFVGYGMTDADHRYDDYEGVDVEGAIAVAFRYEPQRHDAASRFEGVEPARLSDLIFKAINATHHGAAALVVINPPPEAGERDHLYRFDSSPSAVGIPVIHVTWAGAKRIFDRALLERRRRAIDETLTPQSAPIGVGSLAVEIAQAEVAVANVVGRLPATTPNPDGEAIVLGAHYDHLGMGGEGSMRPGTTAVHAGADDNASGVATILEIAEALNAGPRARDAYLVAFTAEESGLLGSHHFVAHGPVPAEKITAMLNFDMVGRLRGRELTVLGVDTGEGLREALRRAAMGLPLDLSLGSGGFGPSDQMAFHARDVPVLHFFTGTHDEYHTPDDTVETLEPEGAAQVATLAFRAARELVNAQAAPAASAAHHAGQARSYGPSFGSIPAFGGDDTDGVPLSGVRPGSPADLAGVEAGDVLVRFGEFEVRDLREFAFALRQHEPGQVVEVVVLRDGEELILEATLAGGD